VGIVDRVGAEIVLAVTAGADLADGVARGGVALADVVAEPVRQDAFEPLAAVAAVMDGRVDIDGPGGDIEHERLRSGAIFVGRVYANGMRRAREPRG
jgi:hypothetical protein